MTDSETFLIEAQFLVLILADSSSLLMYPTAEAIPLF